MQFTRYCLTHWIPKLPGSFEFHRPRQCLLKCSSFISNKGPVEIDITLKLDSNFMSDLKILPNFDTVNSVYFIFLPAILHGSAKLSIGKFHYLINWLIAIHQHFILLQLPLPLLPSLLAVHATPISIKLLWTLFFLWHSHPSYTKRHHRVGPGLPTTHLHSTPLSVYLPSCTVAVVAYLRTWS